MACLDACAPEPILRVAALLHDVGKPRSRAFSEKTNDWTFYEHEAIGGRMAEPIMQRLKFSNDEKTLVTSLVRHHLICYTSDWSDAAVRRWMRRVGVELVPQLYKLGRADALGKGRPAEQDLANLSELEQRAAKIIELGAALSTRDLAVRGNDLMSELGLKPGPTIGRVLDALLELVLETPEKNERGPLLEEARRIVGELTSGL
jgi:tRNA nucleotidyltransferase (CCA-adding enzyme)